MGAMYRWGVEVGWSHLPDAGHVVDDEGHLDAPREQALQRLLALLSNRMEGREGGSRPKVRV